MTIPNISTVEIVHPNGECRTFDIESFHKTFVTIRWGLAGTYKIRLKDNVMISFSGGGKKAAKPCPWKAKDIGELRRLVHEHFNPVHKDARDDMYARHVENMPAKV